MAVFEFEGVDGQEKQVRGTVVGADLRAAADQLERRGVKVSRLGLAPSGFEPLAPSAPSGPRSAWATEVAGPLVGRVPLPDLMFFFRQLGTLLEAGIGPAQAFGTLSRQTKSPKLREILIEAQGQVTAGAPISFTLQRYPEAFSPLILSLVRVGEETGNLDSVCAQIADYLEDDIDLRNLIRRETLYPKILAVCALLIPLAANTVLAGVGGRPLYSPFLTPGFWFFFVPLALGGFLFVRYGLRNPRIKKGFDEALGSVPWVGKTVHGFAMAKFGRAFGALYKGGVPIPRAAALAADATGNEHLRSRMAGVPAMLESGQGVADSLRQTGVVDDLVLDMVHTGEATGNLDQMLIKVSTFYEGECRTRARQQVLVFGTVLYLAIAVVVAFMIISAWSGYGASFKGAMG